jgi:hypothetical protein
MLKMTASFVLASLRGSTYPRGYASASSRAAAALDSHFEHPAGTVLAHDYSKVTVGSAQTEFSSKWCLTRFPQVPIVSATMLQPESGGSQEYDAFLIFIANSQLELASETLGVLYATCHRCSAI